LAAGLWDSGVDVFFVAALRSTLLGSVFAVYVFHLVFAKWHNEPATQLQVYLAAYGATAIVGTIIFALSNAVMLAIRRTFPTSRAALVSGFLYIARGAVIGCRCELYLAGDMGRALRTAACQLRYPRAGGGHADT
jgi:hypothetical protein